MEFEGNHIDKELREMEDQGWTLENTAMEYSVKDRLYKYFPGPSLSPERNHFDMWSIASMEGDLSDSQISEFDRLLENDPDLVKEWESWMACRLPVQKMAYPSKEKLKKKIPGRSRALWFSSVAAAAAIALVLTVTRDVPELIEHSSEQEAFSPEAEALSREFPVEEAELTLASKPVLPSIRKEREPRELTGDKKSEPLQQDSTTSVSIARVVEVVPNRLSLNQSQRAEVRPDLDIAYDQIKSLNLPVYSSGRKGLDWNRISNEGIRIANAGLKQINRMTGSDLNLEVSKGEEGKLKSFRFQTGLFNVESIQGNSD